MRDAATLREALEANSRYLRLHHEGGTLSLEKVGDAAFFRLEVLSDGSSSGRQSAEMGIGEVHRTIRHLLGDAWRPRPVWFSHSAPANVTTHRSMFGARVEFGAIATEFCWSRKISTRRYPEPTR